MDILRHMGLQPFLAWPHPPDNLRPSHIARALGVTPETVKERVSRMEADGVISGYEIYPNLRHLGVHATTYHFRVGEGRPKEQGLADVKNVEGVVGVFDYIGPTVCVDLAYRHPKELERKVGLVARLLDAQALPHPCFDYAPPEVARALTNLDWRIIQALRGQARRRPEDVARGLGVSARTVRRRIERLAAEGSIDIVPRLDTSRISGAVLYELLVTLEEDLPADRLPARFERLCRGALCSAWPMPERARRCATLLLLARSVSDIERMRREAESTPGVVAVEVLIPAGSVGRPEWIDEAIEARIAESAPAKAPTATARAAPGEDAA